MLHMWCPTHGNDCHVSINYMYIAEAHRTIFQKEMLRVESEVNIGEHFLKESPG